MENGGPAPDAVTNQIYELTQKISQYKYVPEIDCEFTELGEQTFKV